MINDYSQKYHVVLSELQVAKQEARSYPQKTSRDEEKETDKKLGALEKTLQANPSLKAATSLVGMIRDILNFNFWADIPESAWNTMIEAIIKLKNPKETTFDEVRKIYRTLHKYDLEVMPITGKAALLNKEI